jgi:hypothetical protein
MSVIRYTAVRPFVLHVNHTGADLTAALKPKPEQDPDTGQVAGTDAVVGGSTD